MSTTCLNRPGLRQRLGQRQHLGGVGVIDVIGVVSLISLWLTPWSASAQQAPVERFIDYTVVRGDTCTGIAKKVYGEGKLCYKMISKYNKMNQRFVIIPGQTLRLPTREELGVEEPDPDAVVSARKGKVQARPPEQDAWKEASAGESLWRLWRVSSGERSSAEVSFTRIQGKLELRENTLVIIYGPDNSKVQTTPSSRAVLERGALRSRLDELSGQDPTARERLEVQTPAALATLQGVGQTLFDVEESGTTRVANLDQEGVSLMGRDPDAQGPTPEQGAKPKPKAKPKPRKAVALPKNTGSKIVPGQDPTPPKPLPASPRWRTSGPLRVLALGERSSALIQWEPVPGASSYRVELAGQADGRQVLDTFTVDAKFEQVTLEDLPAREYWARVSALDADRFEGRPSAALALDVTPISPTPPRGVEAPQVGQVFVGSTFALPGLRCRLEGDSTPVEWLRLSRPGPQKVLCVDAQGLPSSPLTVDVQPIQVTGLEQGLTLAAGQTKTLELASQPAASTLTIQAPPGVQVVAQEPLGQGRWRVTLRAAPDAQPGQGELKLLAGQGQEVTPLATTTAQVVALDPAQRQDQSAQGLHDASALAGQSPLRLGVYGLGLGLHNAASALEQQPLAEAFALGLRLDWSLGLQTWVGLEADVGQTSLTQLSSRAQAFGLRAYGAWRVTPRVLSPMLRAGVGVDVQRYYGAIELGSRAYDPQDRRTRVRVPLEVGLGVLLDLDDSWSARVELVEHLTPWGGQGLGLRTGAMMGLSVAY